MVSQFYKENARAMSEEQFCQVVEAILNGKYSWACLLILKFAGYNPLHYIPYRTYNRLMKEHNGCKKGKGKTQGQDINPSLEVENLPHMKTVNTSSRSLKGGNGIGILEDSLYLPELIAFWY